VYRTGVARPLVLLWLDEAEVYAQAVERAGLSGRVELATLRVGETPDPALLARVEELSSAYRPGMTLPRPGPPPKWIPPK